MTVTLEGAAQELVTVLMTLTVVVLGVSLVVLVVLLIVLLVTLVAEPRNGSPVVTSWPRCPKQVKRPSSVTLIAWSEGKYVNF